MSIFPNLFFLIVPLTHQMYMPPDVTVKSIGTLTTSNAGSGVDGATGTLIRCWWECEMVQLYWKTVWWFLTKLNILLPYDPENCVLFGNHPQKFQYLCPCKTVSTDVDGSFIHNCQHSKAAKMPFSM